jgi:hypothetical protein
MGLAGLDNAMVGIIPDIVGAGIQMQGGTGQTGSVAYSICDQYLNRRFTIGYDGFHQWGVSNSLTTMDTGLSRFSPATIVIGNGSDGDYSGTLLATNLTAGAYATPGSSSTSYSVIPPSTPTRNDATIGLGMSFQVTTPIIVSSLGRKYISGNSSNHMAYLWSSAGSGTLLASGDILAASSSDGNGFKWVSVTPVTLTPGLTYFLIIDELNGGDTWVNPYPNAVTLNAQFTNWASTTATAGGSYPSGGPTYGDQYSSGAMAYTYGGGSAVSVTPTVIRFADSGVVDGGISSITSGYFAFGNGTAGDCSGHIRLGNGSAGAPAYSFGAAGSSPYQYSSGMFVANGYLGLSYAGTATLFATATRVGASNFVLGDGSVYGFTSTASFLDSVDTGISRLGAASLAIGNGTIGDYSGSLKLTHLVFPSAGDETWNGDTSISRASANVIQIGNTGGTPDASGTLELANLNMMDAASGATPVLNLTAGGVSGNDPYLTVSGSDGGTGEGVIFRIMNTYVGELSLSALDMCCYNDTTKGGTLIGGNYTYAPYGFVSGFSIRAKANTPDICISTGAFTGGNSNVGAHLMMQDTTGRIGIGTFAAPNFSPQATLDVTGNIRTDQLQLGTSAGINGGSGAYFYFGDGNLNDTQGTLGCKMVQLSASSGAPTSAGTAGTEGQIIYYGGFAYLCSVTGEAGAATWNKLSMVAV